MGIFNQRSDTPFTYRMDAYGPQENPKAYASIPYMKGVGTCWTRFEPREHQDSFQTNTNFGKCFQKAQAPPDKRAIKRHCVQMIMIMNLYEYVQRRFTLLLGEIGLQHVNAAPTPPLIQQVIMS